MQIIPRIYFSGNCGEAIELYKDTFGATVDYKMTFGDAKMGTEDQKNMIINCQVDFKGHKFHFGDNMRETIVSGNQLSFTVVLGNPDEVKEAYEKLIAANGTSVMEPAPTFFSPCHCAVVDKFGVIWQINCTK